MPDTNPLENRTLTIEKTFDAPLNLVWEAWTTAGHITHWWGPPGMKTRVLAHDFTPGGQWKYAMAMADGREFIAEGTFTEIVHLKHIISSANFKPMTEGVQIEAHFKEHGQKTPFTFKCVHPTEDYCRQQEEMGFYNGWGSVFARLDAFLLSKARPD